MTHEHGDRAKYTKQFVDYGVISYMTAGIKQAMNVESHRLCMIKAKQVLRIGTWSILPFDIDHCAKEPVAFLLQSTIGYK
ncbi:MBL fold metallo-hydrolase, partial [Staphylococcus aureus]